MLLHVKYTVDTWRNYERISFSVEFGKTVAYSALRLTLTNITSAVLVSSYTNSIEPAFQALSVSSPSLHATEEANCIPES